MFWSDLLIFLFFVHYSQLSLGANLAEIVEKCASINLLHDFDAHMFEGLICFFEINFTVQVHVLP